MSRRHALAGLLLVLLASGCGSDARRDGGWAAVGAVGGMLKSATGGRAAAAASTGLPELTREQVAGSPTPLLLVALEKRGVGTALGRISSNRGTRTYATSDLTTITLRDGVLISTRGLDGDLMAADVPSAARIASADGTHSRSYQFLAADDRTTSQHVECRLAPAGHEPVAIAGRTWPTRIVAETCQGSVGAFENRYWIDPAGEIRKSRQWAGSVAGMLQIADPGG